MCFQPSTTLPWPRRPPPIYYRCPLPPPPFRSHQVFYMMNFLSHRSYSWIIMTEKYGHSNSQCFSPKKKGLNPEIFEKIYPLVPFGWSTRLISTANSAQFHSKRAELAIAERLVDTKWPPRIISFNSTGLRSYILVQNHWGLKGQLISKADLKVFIWTKKPTKIFFVFLP